VEEPDIPDRIKKDFEHARQVLDDGNYARAKTLLKNIQAECSRVKSEAKQKAETLYAAAKEKSQVLYEDTETTKNFEQAEKLYREGQYNAAASWFNQVTIQCAEIEQKKREQQELAEKLREEALRLHISAKEKSIIPKYKEKVEELFALGVRDLQNGKYASAKETFEKILSRCDEIDQAEKLQQQLQIEAERVHISAKQLYDKPLYKEAVVADFGIGEKLLQEKNWELAKQNFEKVITISKAIDGEIRRATEVKERNRINAKMAMDKMEQLLPNKDYQLAITTDFDTGKKLFEEEKYELALETFQKIHDTVKAIDTAKIEVMNLQKIVTSVKNNPLYQHEIAKLIQDGEKFIQEHNYTLAKKCFTDALQIKDNIDNEKSEAEKLYEIVKELKGSPNSANTIAAQIAAGKKFLDAGNFKLAKESFEKVKKIVQDEMKLKDDVEVLRAEIDSKIGITKRYYGNGYKGSIDFEPKLVNRSWGPSEEMRQQFRSGEKYRAEGDFPNAKRCYETVLQRYHTLRQQLQR
jgi:outer membrane protein assembly factor BamD (BamD/ComL family)